MERLTAKLAARVAVMAPVYRLLHYAVPDELAAEAQPGRRVAVPLGRGHAEGVLVDTDHPPPPSMILKPLLAVDGSAPALDADRLALGLWMAERYAAPPGECLRLFFPPGGGGGLEPTFTITPAGQERLADPPQPGPFADRVLALVAAHPGAALGSLRRRLPAPGLNRALAGLERAGWVTRGHLPTGDGPQARTGRQVELLPAAADTGPLPVRQARLLAWLAGHAGSVATSVAIRESGTAPDVLTALARKGLVRVWAGPRPGDPLAGWSARPERHPLTPAQAAAVDRCRADLTGGGGGQFLLLGVTGSGKSRVYTELVHTALALGRTALVLVPEIALTPALGRRLLAEFEPAGVALLHSSLPAGERADAWRRIRDGRARVAVGTRSALFCPLPRPGLVVIDEEHDGSYKQGETPRYHAREVARWWSRRCGATLVLGSATPSLEAFHAATEGGGLELLELPERVERRPLPRVQVVDMSAEFARHGGNIVLAAPVHRALTECLRRREQVIVLLNRRGFSGLLLCRRCGEHLSCPHCSISLTYHHAARQIRCHYCGACRPPPDRCPGCDSPYIHYLGTGTEKLELLLQRRFPGRTTARFDRDTTSRRGSLREILERFERREVDVLVGTQMIAKGHDFPGVTLVAVLSTDTTLRVPDFRAAERTFQLLTQVAGRSGRGQEPGQVFVQTYYPDHYAVRHARAQDYRAFYAEESGYRRRLFYPPYTRLVYLSVQARSETAAAQLAHRVAGLLREIIAERNLGGGLRLTGPATAQLERLKDEHRWSLLVRCQDGECLPAVLAEFRERYAAARLPVKGLTVDVDPLELS